MRFWYKIPAVYDENLRPFLDLDTGFDWVYWIEEDAGEDFCILSTPTEQPDLVAYTIAERGDLRHEASYEKDDI